jgi:hypothetical protein
MKVRVNRRGVQFVGRLLRGSGFVIEAEVVLDPDEASPAYITLPPLRCETKTPLADF